MSFSILNEDSKVTVVQNNVDRLKSLTISSVEDLQQQLDLRYIKLETDSLLEKKENVFNVQSPLIFSSTDISNKPTLSVDSYAKNDTYTKSEVNQQINNLIDAAPSQLNTLNEISKAINDDSNFATTVINSIGTKQPILKNTGGIGSTIFNNYDNSIRQIYSISPVQTSIYFDPFNPTSDKMNNIQISLDESYNESLNAKADLLFVNTTKTDLINDISKKSNISDVYTKIDSDITTSNLSNQIITKANIIDVYSKNESDSKLTGATTLINNDIVLKANASDVYTKTQSDATLTSNNTSLNNAIALKANSADVYTKSQSDSALTSNTATLSNAISLKADSLTLSNNYNTLSTAINLKGDKTDITASLALKADSLTVSNNYNTLNNEINLKANQTDLTSSISTVNSFIALKANSSDVVSSLNLKVDKTDLTSSIATLNSGIGLKANTSDVITSLGLKVDKTDLTSSIATLNSSIGLKANSSDVNSSLNLKVDKTDLTSSIAILNSSIALKADTSTLTTNISSINSSLGLKANTSDINTALNLKANQTDLTSNYNILTTNINTLNTSLALKANTSDLTSNISTLNTEINKKSNISDVYTKIDTYSKAEVNQQITNLIDAAPSTLNTLAELASAIGNDKNYSTTVVNLVASKNPTITNYQGSLPLYDASTSKIRQIFSTTPIISSIYNNPLNALDSNNGNINLSLDSSYLDTVYSKTDSDFRYPVKSTDINGNNNITLDSKYRMQSDGTNFYIQRYDNDGIIKTDSWCDVVSFIWDTNSNSAKIWMNGVDILTSISNNSQGLSGLINYQPLLTITKTAASPLSLLNNILTVDLSNYSTTSTIANFYQKIFTTTLPLSLNTTTNILSIDLSQYQKSIIVDTTTASPLTLNSLTNALTIDLSSYQTKLSVVNTIDSPLLLNSLTNALTIDLSTYQKKISVTNTTASPLTLNSSTNALTINLSNYQKALVVNTTTASPLTLNPTTNALSIDLSNYATVASSSGTITVTTSTDSPLIFANNNLSINLTGYYKISSKTLAERFDDGYNHTCVYIDSVYRVLSDKQNFYIQRVNPDPQITDWINIAQFGYSIYSQTSSFFMNGVDILALIASKTIDLANLRTTLTSNINFINSYGSTMAYFDDSSNFTTYGVLTNTGGAQFNNGIQVSGGSSISYDPTHKLELLPTGTKITGDLLITGALSFNTFSIGNDISFTNPTQTSIIGKKSLVLGQTGDTLGASYLTLQNRDGVNGALFQTQNTDPNNTLVDFGFLMTNGIQRNFRLEGRSLYAKCGSPSFMFGGFQSAPTCAVGDNYAGITKLAVGSYTSPGTNSLSVTGNTTVSGSLTVSSGMTVTGNVSMPGYMFCAGLVSATGSKLTSSGQVAYTVARLSGYAVGVWTITFASAHPLGGNYIATVSARNCIFYISSNPNPTATSLVVCTFLPNTNTLADAVFSFMVLS